MLWSHRPPQDRRSRNAQIHMSILKRQIMLKHKCQMSAQHNCTEFTMRKRKRTHLTVQEHISIENLQKSESMRVISNDLYCNGCTH